MIFGRLAILKTLFPDNRQAAADCAPRWARMAADNPKLVQDIIRLGGILDKRTKEYRDGIAVPNPICPYTMAEENGRREFAVELLAMMQLTPEELRKLTEYDT